ncbi:hypothetical protein P280DRAFT_512052 [Massarina eburnea CBS 473.64]|uniref:Uncharacterized protein n=1 Tax=Massarina eburnea CBS 473.64 TaxID=1395130 RepID=A0A6A6RJH2_9PLEO|nr:hypothetical protein P280DRAFT_512052 [Massarina eburnea CBS 473.64]
MPPRPTLTLLTQTHTTHNTTTKKMPPQSPLYDEPPSPIPITERISPDVSPPPLPGCPHTHRSTLGARLIPPIYCPICTLESDISAIKSAQATLVARGGIFASLSISFDDEFRIVHQRQNDLHDKYVRRLNTAKMNAANRVLSFEALLDFMLERERKGCCVWESKVQRRMLEEALGIWERECGVWLRGEACCATPGVEMLEGRLGRGIFGRWVFWVGGKVGRVVGRARKDFSGLYGFHSLDRILTHLTNARRGWLTWENVDTSFVSLGWREVENLIIAENSETKDTGFPSLAWRKMKDIVPMQWTLRQSRPSIRVE